MDIEPTANPFRHANLRLLALVRHTCAADAVPFICECEDVVCFETVLLSTADFEQLCVEGGFAIVRGHPLPTVHAREHD